MTYAEFVKRREPAWLAFENNLAQLRQLDYEAVEQLAVDYRRVLQDYTFARDRFPGTGATRRLQQLSRSATRILLNQESRNRSGLGVFFLQRFPRTMRRHLTTLAVSAALFLTATLFGLVLAMAQPGLSRILLGEEAIEGLKQGRMWTESLTSTTPQSVSSSGIATNNLSVALTTWVGGALAGSLTLWILILNGFHLGALFAITMQYSMAGELGEFVLAHGPLELSVIVIASGAGLLLMRGLVQFDDRPRGEMMRTMGNDSLVIMGGCLPWLVPLALIETFLSPQPAIPVAVKAAVGCAVLAVFLVVAFRRPTTDQVEREEADV